ncbi:hypothetical protein BKA64DRAFT_450161 [Cadophora sp. MPI-SDFR-AT-0126]|nr:hypothetical protein BKA64DRAFT_450161 [Leotiomycetes sp. MPI-SDFR-AT-0126]
MHGKAWRGMIVNEIRYLENLIISFTTMFFLLLPYAVFPFHHCCLLRHSINIALVSIFDFSCFSVWGSIMAIKSRLVFLTSAACISLSISLGTLSPFLHNLSALVVSPATDLHEQRPRT